MEYFKKALMRWDELVVTHCGDSKHITHFPLYFCALHGRWLNLKSFKWKKCVRKDFRIVSCKKWDILKHLLLELQRLQWRSNEEVRELWILEFRQVKSRCMFNVRCKWDWRGFCWEMMGARMSPSGVWGWWSSRFTVLTDIWILYAVAWSTKPVPAVPADWLIDWSIASCCFKAFLFFLLPTTRTRRRRPTSSNNKFHRSS